VLRTALRALTFCTPCSTHLQYPVPTVPTRTVQHPTVSFTPCSTHSTLQYPTVTLAHAVPTVPCSTHLQYPQYRDRDCRSTHGYCAVPARVTNRPPSKLEADSKGRGAKQIDHYVGQRITKHIGTRSVQLEMEEPNGRTITYKRDIGMLLLKRPKAGDPDPTIRQRAALGTRIHVRGSTERVPIQVGEHVIVKDVTLASTWYCAEVSRIERNWIEVNYYTTITPSLEDYTTASRQARLSRLKDATFLRTWVLRSSGGLPITVAPSSDRDRVEHLWRGRIPVEHLNDHILVRDIGLNARGKLDRITRDIAARLNIPHNCGA
jgi:hypothetical protein